MYVNGSSSKKGSGAGLILAGPGEQKLKYTLRFKFLASNNEVMYEALIQSIDLGKEVRANKLVAHSDSQLAV